MLQNPKMWNNWYVANLGNLPVSDYHSSWCKNERLRRTFTSTYIKWLPLDHISNDLNFSSVTNYNTTFGLGLSITEHVCQAREQTPIYVILFYSGANIILLSLVNSKAAHAVFRAELVRKYITILTLLLAMRLQIYQLCIINHAY